MENKKKHPVSEKKLTLDEYKFKYSKPQNVKSARFFLILFAAAIGIIIFTCLLIVVLKVFEINEIAGYVSIAPAVFVFVLFYIVPLVKINKLPYFQTVVDQRNIKQAKAHNRKVRETLADNIIQFASETDNIGWYDDARVGKLAVARQTKNNEDLKKTLTGIFNNDVKKQARKIITKSSVQVGFFTALSPDDKLDSAIVALLELNLVKDLLFLYGFRPSEARLARIFGTIVSNSLIAYGVSSVSTKAGVAIGETIAKAASAAHPAIAALVSVVSSVVGPAAQGVVNGVLTTIIGKQTQRYLMMEYNLQNIVDDIVYEDDESEIIEEVKETITNSVKNNKKKEKLATV